MNKNRFVLWQEVALCQTLLSEWETGIPSRNLFQLTSWKFSGKYQTAFLLVIVQVQHIILRLSMDDHDVRMEMFLYATYGLCGPKVAILLF